jgi:hypothetical protein
MFGKAESHVFHPESRCDGPSEASIGIYAAC